MPPGLRIAQAWLAACVALVLLGIAALVLGGSPGREATLDARAGLVRALALSTLALEPAAARLQAPQGAPQIDRRFMPSLPAPGSPGEAGGGER